MFKYRLLASHFISIMYLNSVPFVVIRKLLYNFHDDFMYEPFSPLPLESPLLAQNVLLTKICG